jgi:hypothetical protein
MVANSGVKRLKFEAIRKALVQPLGAILVGFDVVYPNQEYISKPNVNHARVFLIPNQPTVASLGAGGYDQHTGILQVSLYTPKEKTDFPLLRAADEIERTYQAFVRGSYLTADGVNVRVTSIGIGAAQFNDQWFFAPVTIAFTSHIKGL